MITLPRVAAILVGVGMSSVPALAQCASWKDYDHSGTANTYDLTAFIADYGNLDPEADLNRDGQVNTIDSTIFYSAGLCPANFTTYWMVTTTIDLTGGRLYDMDDEVDLTGIDISRNAAICYEQHFPWFPKIWAVDEDERDAGLHLMLSDNVCNSSAACNVSCYYYTNNSYPWGYTYNNWQTNWERWLGKHLCSIPAALDTVIPTKASFDGLVCIDFETIHPLWAVTKTDLNTGTTGLHYQADRWQDCVEQINKGSWDTNFLTLVGWPAPGGTTSIGDLNPTQLDDLLKVSWEYFAFSFFLETIDAVGGAGGAPYSKVGMYDYPFARYDTPTMTDESRNDDLAAFWAALDYLAPSVYASRHVYSGSAPSPCPCDTDMCAPIDDNAAYYLNAINECKRIRTAYNSDLEIYPFIAWTYGWQVGTDCFANGDGTFITDENIDQQLFLPWVYNANGILLWGHTKPSGQSPRYSPEDITDELNRSVWKDTINLLSNP